MKKNYFLTFLLTLFISVFSFGQEMLLNGGFENWDNDTSPTSWTKVENTTKDATEKHGGSFSAKHIGGTKDLGQTITGIVPGDSYTITIWYKVTAGDATSARIWSYWKDNSNSNIDNNDNDTEGAIRGPNNAYLENNGGVWSKYETTITAPAGAAKFYFELRTYSGATVYWDDLSFMHNVASTDPILTIAQPTDGQILDATTNVSVLIGVNNFNVAAGGAGDGYIKWKLNDVAQADKTEVNDIVLTVAPGNSYKIYMELVDNSGNPLNTPVNKTVNFSVAQPCDLVLSTITTTCDAITSGVDTYNGSIAFTGGNTGGTYTITVPNGVVVGGDNPNTSATGTITFTGMTEGVDAEITIVGSGTSSCNYKKTLSAPTCVPFPIVETFNYTADTDLIATPNWNDHSKSSTPNNIQVKTGAITNYYTAAQYPDPTGNMLSLVAGGSDPAIKFNETSTGTVYASFLFQITNMDNFKTNTNGDYFAILAQPNGSFKVRLWIKDNTAEGKTFQVGISNGSTGIFDRGFTANIGEPVFVVMAYDFDAERIILWINPDATTFETATPPGSNAGSVIVGSNVATSLSKFILRQDKTSDTPSIDFDELRIGTTWAQVTPKGSTASVGENSIEGFAAYPNPVNNGRLTIKSSNSDEKEVTIFNVIGKRVFTQKFSGKTKQLDVSNISSGIYIMKVLEGDKIATKKLVIE